MKTRKGEESVEVPHTEKRQSVNCSDSLNMNSADVEQSDLRDEDIYELPVNLFRLIVQR